MGAEYNDPVDHDDEVRAALRMRLEAGPPLLLDGAMGTELEKRGLRSELPLWSAHALLEAPEEVRAVHTAYVRAGAEILTANTFRTQRHTLARAGLGERAASLTALAVDLARAASLAATRRVFVAGSAPPLEDCYRPDLAPDTTTLEREHGSHTRALADAGVDLIALETHNSIREAVVAARAAVASGVPWLVSFVSWEAAKLLSGESLRDALAAVVPFEPMCVLVNCLPPRTVPACLGVLRSCKLPFGVYANLGAPTEGGRRSDELDPDGFAREAARWAEAGARIVGGCCGTTPEHIRAIADRP